MVKNLRSKISICFILTGLLLSFAAAKGEVVWLEKEYDFGLIKEEAGEKTGFVRLVNTGPEEVVITGARPSCGCTGVEYPEDPIAPGDTIKFSFTYNPLGRPGRFEKSIRVYIGEFDMATIRIRGIVLGTPESLYTSYPIEVGALRLSADRMLAGDVRYGSTCHLFISGYNQTTDTIYPSVHCKDAALSVSTSSEFVAPGDILTFSLYLSSRKKTEIGPIEIPIEIVSDKLPDAPKTEVLFLANITPDFSSMTPEEVAAGPRCYLAPDRFDLGEIDSGKQSVRRFKFAIRNDGKSPMRVMRVFSHSETVKMTRWPSTLKPGKSDFAEGAIDTSLLPAGPFNIKVDVLTDDPLHPVKVFSIVGIKN